MRRSPAPPARAAQTFAQCLEDAPLRSLTGHCGAATCQRLRRGGQFTLFATLCDIPGQRPLASISSIGSFRPSGPPSCSWTRPANNVLTPTPQLPPRWYTEEVAESTGVRATVQREQDAKAWRWSRRRDGADASATWHARSRPGSADPSRRGTNDAAPSCWIVKA